MGNTPASSPRREPSGLWPHADGWRSVDGSANAELGPEVARNELTLESPWFAPIQPDGVRAWKRASAVLGGASVAIALTVLLGGWVFQVAVLRSFGHGNVDMVANTSLSLVLGSLALIAHLLDARIAHGNTLGRILSLGVAVIALVTLYEWLTRTGLGIDQLLFTPAPGSLGAPYLGRIAPNAVIALLLVSGALELSLTGRTAALRQCFLLAAAAIALVAFLGYASQVPTLYGGAAGTEMALPASLGLLALAVGILASQPADGFLSHLTRHSPGAALARRLLPAVIGIPMILSVLLFVSRRTGLVGTNVGIWLVVLLTIALFCGVSVVYARALDAAERQRREQALLAHKAEQRRKGELSYLADHDPLTGLFNRRRFRAEVELELIHARHNGTAGAVLAIDLDHFKFINDSLSHRVGDQVIIKASDIVGKRLRRSDVMARPGSDEFAAMLCDVDAEQAALIAGDLLDAIRSESQIDSPNGIRRVTASIGLAAFGAGDELTTDDLLAKADIAMYDAKYTGRDRVTVYDHANESHRRMRASRSWSEQIRDALQNDRFVLHAQPILSFRGDPTPRYELLVRMIGEDGTLIAPGVFLHIAERMNLIQEIDRWVLHEAIQVLGDKQRAGSDIRLHVNLSALSIIDPELAQAIADELKAAGASGPGLCLEITETTAVINLQQAKRFATQVAELRCEVALDDFGAGYASFHYLKHLEFDYLKIDGEFIQNITHNLIDQLVVHTLASIAKTLGKRTIAEYVGDHETVQLLRSYGVDFGQGFYLAEPMPLDQTDLTTI